MIRKGKVVLVFRDPSRKGTSVEEIYHGLVNAMSSTMDIDTYLYDDKRSVLFNWQAIRKKNPTIIHITSDVYFLAIFFRTVKVVLTIHDIGRLKELKGVKRFIYRMFWILLPSKFSNIIICVSEYTKRDLKAALGKNIGRKIRVINNPLPVSFEYVPKKFNHSKPVILAVGTGVHKNIRTLVRAVDGLSCKLVLIGNMDKMLYELLSTSGVEWLNFERLSSEEIINCYRECDIVYFVSLHEGFGMPIIEGQATGRPILVSRKCSIPEVAAKGAHYIEDPLNYHEVRKGLDLLIEKIAYRENLVEEGLKNIKRFDFNLIQKKYRSLYFELIEQV